MQRARGGGAPILGPLAGLGVLVTVAVLVLVPRVNDAAGGRIDVSGAIGLAVGLSAFLIAVSKANDWGWTSGATLGLGIGGILVLIGWGFFELRQREPLVDLRKLEIVQVLTRGASTSSR